MQNFHTSKTELHFGFDITHLFTMMRMVSMWKPLLWFMEGPVCHSCNCTQMGSGGTVQDVLILCMVNTQNGVVWGNQREINISVNTLPPGVFLWSIIYVLRRAKKLCLKINFFAFAVFSSLKEMCVFMWWMSNRRGNVDVERRGRDHS